MFALRSSAFFPYHESTVRWLCENGHSVHVALDPVWSKNADDAAIRRAATEIPNLTFGEMPTRRGKRKFIKQFLRELLGIRSYLVRDDQDSFYLKRQERYTFSKFPRRISHYLRKSRIHRVMLRIPFAAQILRMPERWIPADSDVLQQVEGMDADVIVATPCDMRYGDDIEYVKAARQLGVPSVIPVLSWDNLTTKGAIAVPPDMLIAWNDGHAREASMHHRTPKESVLTGGSPFFDKWFDDSVGVQSRGIFCESVGLDPKRPYVLYLGSSVNISGDERWIIKELSDVFAADDRLSKLQILARPHGANTAGWEELNNGSNLIYWHRDRVLPDTPEGFLAFKSALDHSICTLGVNTTALVDAIIFGKPTIGLGIGRYSETNATNAVHYHHMVNSGALVHVTSTGEVAELVERIQSGTDDSVSAREAFVSEWVRPNGLSLPAGAVAGMAMKMLAEGSSVSSIKAAIKAMNK